MSILTVFAVLATIAKGTPGTQSQQEATLKPCGEYAGVPAPISISPSPSAFRSVLLALSVIFFMLPRVQENIPRGSSMVRCAHSNTVSFATD